jgi:hypothetical protein
MRIPKTKRNFFGERPSFFKIVQEKVGGSSPNFPQASNIGGINMEKLKIQTKEIIPMM